MAKESSLIEFKGFDESIDWRSDKRIVFIPLKLLEFVVGFLFFSGIILFLLGGSLVAESQINWYKPSFFNWLMLGGLISVFGSILILLPILIYLEGRTCARCRKNKRREDISFCNGCLIKAFSEADSLFQETVVKIKKMRDFGLDKQIKGAVKAFNESLPKPVKEYLEVQKLQAIQEDLQKIGLKLERFDSDGYTKYPLDTDRASVNLSLDALDVLENLMEVKEVNNG